MKKIFIMLFIAFNAVTTINAQKPVHVDNLLDDIIYFYGEKDKEEYSVYKNPNTNILESRVRIVPFKCEKNNGYINALGYNAFLKDESCCYQIAHILPGKEDKYSITILNKGEGDRHLDIRNWSNEEMWLMCTKNPDNPQLRDAYAIVWSNIDVLRKYAVHSDSIFGKVFLISSLREDIPENQMDNADMGNVTLSDNNVIDNILKDKQGSSTIDASDKAQLEMKGKQLYENIAVLEGLCKTVSTELQSTADYENKMKELEIYFKQIYKQTGLFDMRAKDLLKTAKECMSMNDQDIVLIYKEILNVLIKQNSVYNNIISKYGSLSAPAIKCQEQITVLSTKYMDEMADAM